MFVVHLLMHLAMQNRTSTHVSFLFPWRYSHSNSH